MAPDPKDLIKKLLKGIETGDPEAATVVDEEKYIQHNPLTRTGNVGLAELFKRLSKTSPKVKIVRIFQDGDFVFAHTDYSFNVVEIGFEVFRFENGKAVEHWDNLQSKVPEPNPSGHSMIDGPTDVQDLHLTEDNRELVGSFIEAIMISGDFDRFGEFIDAENYTEHNPKMVDGLDALRDSLTSEAHLRKYETVHRILAEGNFVLSVTEGTFDSKHSSFYDLFRISCGKIVEHWDTVEEVPPGSEWVNDNGKF